MSFETYLAIEKIVADVLPAGADHDDRRTGYSTDNRNPNFTMAAEAPPLSDAELEAIAAEALRR